MRLIALLFLFPNLLLAADTPISLPAAPSGATLHLARLPLTPPAKLEGVTYRGEGILTVRLVLADPAAKQLPSLTLPLRFEPGIHVGDVPTVWSHQSRSVAFILPCHAPRQENANRLFLFRITGEQLLAVALPDIATHLTRLRTDLAFLSVEYSSEEERCFGWIGEDLLVVPFRGSCGLTHDIGDSETREIFGHAVFQLDANGNAIIREILKLEIQG